MSEYTLQRSVQTPAERARLEREFARQQAEEARRAQQERELDAARVADEQRRLAARPWPVRLTEARCTACHPASNFMSVRHALPGWWLVILRMRVLNHAQLEWHEMPVIAGHLAESFPPDAEILWVEWGIPVLAITVVLGGMALRRRIFIRTGDPT